MNRITRIFLCLALLFPMHPAPVQAQDLSACYQGNTQQVQATTHEMITVSNTAIGFTASKLQPTDGSPDPVCAVVTVNTNSISVWGQGTPTASDGMILSAGQNIAVGALNLRSFLMIRAGASDAAVAVQYYVIPTQ